MEFCEICKCATRKPNIMEIQDKFFFKRKVTLCPICRKIIENKVKDGMGLKEATKVLIKIRSPKH